MAENTDPPLGELTLGGDSLRESKDDIPTEKPSEPKSQQVKAALKNLSLHFDLRASQEVEVGEIDEDEEPIKKLITGCYLPKGFLPQGRKLTPEEREKIRTTKYDPSKRKYVERDVPLTQEELECWDYQSSWLCCPVTGSHWRDPGTILGAGLYHAPRFLSDAEKARQSEAAKAVMERKKTEDTNKEEDDDNVAPAPNQVPSFQVYPSVEPPPKYSIRKLGDLPDDVRCGHLEVIIGPAFEFDAYNDGVSGHEGKQIKSRQERGVLDLDQQYNALVFVYYVDKGEGTFERKVCTNRLSFYIDEEHGNRIFPENVESQLSLLIYRTANRFKDPVTGEKNQVLIAKAIKKVIPKLLKAIVREVLLEKSTVSETRFEHAMRMYLLIHQVSIKLILNYPKAYAYLYQSIIRWIQNPFTKQSMKEWPDLEELLIAASLAGIPWPMLREAFVRRLIASLAAHAGIMAETQDMAARIRHMFNQSKGVIHRILYEFSFFVAGSSLWEIDRKYSRCAGSLPKDERDRMRETAMAVKDVDTFEKFWVAMGMDASTADPHDVKRHIVKYFAYLMKEIPKWQAADLDPATFGKIEPPKIEDKDKSVATMGMLNFKAEQRMAQAAHDAEERRKHQGLPKLNKRGKLDRDHCGFALCNRKFSCRTHLMMHIKRIFRRDLIFGYHKKHEALVVEDPRNLTCDACGEIFETEEDIKRHYMMTGVPSFWSAKLNDSLFALPAAAAGEPVEDPVAADPFDEPGLCVICMEEARVAVFTPCGHLACCQDCGNSLRLCPICRTPIADVLLVFYAVQQNVKIFTP